MSDLKDLKKSLPDTEHSFSINVVGIFTKKTYEGNFSCRIPNIKSQAMIAKHRAVLNAGLELNLDIGTKNMHHMLAYLKYTVFQSPKWWEDSDLGYDLFDVNVVEDVYNKVLGFEKEWLEAIWGKEETSEPSSSSQ